MSETSHCLYCLLLFIYLRECLEAFPYYFRFVAYLREWIGTLKFFYLFGHGSILYI